MPAAVKEAIAYTVQTYGQYSTENAQKYVDTMLKTGRLLEECWS
jgi:sulfite reductase alpha subunit-like flavoprotein